MLRYFDSFNYYLVTEVITNPHLPAAVHILTCYWWPPHRTSNCRSTFFIFRVLCMATPAGLEPATSCVTGMRSSQLNYGAIFDIWVGRTPLLSSSPVSVKYGLFNGLQSTPNPSCCGVLGFPDFFIKDSKFCLMVLPRGFEPLSPAWKADNLANLSMGACGGRSNPPFFVLCNCAWLFSHNLWIRPPPRIHWWPQPDSNWHLNLERVAT